MTTKEVEHEAETVPEKENETGSIRHSHDFSVPEESRSVAYSDAPNPPSEPE